MMMMMTFENGKSYSIRFEISNNSSIFDSIRFDMQKHYSHITNKNSGNDDRFL